MLISTLLQVATTLISPAVLEDAQVRNDGVDNSNNLNPRLPEPNPAPIPQPYTTWEPNGQPSVVVVPTQPVGPPAPPPAQTPPVAPVITTAWVQQPSPPPAAVVPDPKTPTWTPGVEPAPTPQRPPGGIPGGGGPPGAPAGPPAGGPPGGIVVGGQATVVLSPDKTVIVENPAITLPPHDAGGPPADAAAAWTSVPPGWYATTYYACQGQGGCAWHISIRPVASGAARTTHGRGGWLSWVGASYGLLAVAAVVAARIL